MNKFLLFIAFLSVGTGLAQEDKENIFIEEGRWSLGGRFAINSYDNEHFRDYTTRNKNFFFSVEPNVGYTFSDNWMLGLNFIYSYNKQENHSPSTDRETVNHQLGLAPYIQKYFPIFDKFAFFAQGSLEYRHRWSKDSPAVENSSVQKNYALLIRPGFSYMVGKKFVLEATTGSLRYSRSNYFEDDIKLAEGNDFGLDFGLKSFQLGAIYFFD